MLSTEDELAKLPVGSVVMCLWDTPPLHHVMQRYSDGWYGFPSHVPVFPLGTCNGETVAVLWDSNADPAQRPEDIEAWKPKKTPTRWEAAKDLETVGPGGVCEDCGHFAERHSNDECDGFADQPCNTGTGPDGACAGMLWQGHRITMKPTGGGPVLE